MNDSGAFSDENGNIIGDSVVLPEITVNPTTPQTNSSSYYQQWLMREADRGGRNMSSSDREAYDKMMGRIANQNEVKNFTGFDGTIYKHGSGALEQVSPEFDALTLGRQLYTDGLFNGIGNVSKNTLKKAHIGNYYVKPQYNNYSYIKQIGDDAVDYSYGTKQYNFTSLKNWTPEQWTAAQDAAIARGDMAEAQKLRDLHFIVSAPNSVTYDVFHHGNTKPMNWYIFDPKRVGTTDEGYSGAGYYFAPTKPASQYTRENLPHTLGPHGEQNAGLSGGKYHRYVYLNGKTKYKPLREHDWTTHTDFPFVDNRPTEVVVGDNRQIKLADAVTYDDNGVRIPLGLRDNFKNKDIRYGLIPLSIGGTALSNQYAEGGPENTNREYKSANSWSTVNVGKALAPILEPISRTIMDSGETWALFSKDKNFTITNDDTSTAKSTYLMPRSAQRAVFLDRGYEPRPKDYGLVKKAVGNKNIPVY